MIRHLKIAITSEMTAFAVAVVLMSTAGRAQAPSSSAAPRFEVATIKPSAATGSHFVCHAIDSGRPPGSTPALGRCSIAHNTLQMLIGVSYAMDLSLVKGGPEWASSEFFDIETKAEDPSKTTRDMMGAMLRSLLADRFKLVFHRETVEVPGYVLVVTNPSKLKPSENEDPRSGISGGPVGPIVSRHWFISRLALILSQRLGQPVLDQTNLTQPYDYTLTWGEGAGGFGGERGGPSIFTALQEQLGLKLESRKVSVENLIIDSAERPEYNGR